MPSLNGQPILGFAAVSTGLKKDCMDIHAYLKIIGAWVLTSGFQILLIFVLLMIALKAANLFSDRAAHLLLQKNKNQEFRKRADTLKEIIKTTLSITIVALGGMMILGQLGINFGPVLAAAGVAGVAVGFGSQKLVADVISGFFLLLEDQIRIGDVVQIGDKGGLVEHINLRTIILRDFSGSVHFIRTSLIDVVTNMTKDFSFFVFDIAVAYRENVDEVIRVIREVDETLRQDEPYKNDILDKIEIAGLDKFGDSAVVIKGRLKTLPIRQWDVGREFNRRLKLAFEEKGIEMPYPHLTVYAGADKEGRAPAFPLQMNAESTRAAQPAVRKESHHA